jgi:hypothetical protein
MTRSPELGRNSSVEDVNVSILSQDLFESRQPVMRMARAIFNKSTLSTSLE